MALPLSAVPRVKPASAVSACERDRCDFKRTQVVSPEPRVAAAEEALVRSAARLRAVCRENGVRSSLSTFVHELIEFKFELAPAVFFFCARDHLRNRSVGRATKQFANFSEPHPAAVAIPSAGRTIGAARVVRTIRVVMVMTTAAVSTAIWTLTCASLKKLRSPGSNSRSWLASGNRKAVE